jgi:hypothetical protein
MACLTSLEQQQDGWSGVALKTGQVKKFKTLDDYNRYVKSLEEQGTYCATIEPQYTQQYTQGESRQEPGFMMFKPRDEAAQAKYSAMSKTWEGVESSEAAVARGDFSLDSAETTRRELREQLPISQEKPRQINWESPQSVYQTCVIQ